MYRYTNAGIETNEVWLQVPERVPIDETFNIAQIECFPEPSLCSLGFTTTTCNLRVQVHHFRIPLRRPTTTTTTARSTVGGGVG